MLLFVLYVLGSFYSIYVGLIMAVDVLLDWSSVKKFHKVVCGIHTKNSVVLSLLCNFDQSGPYPNRKLANKIIYYIGAQTPSGGFKALVSMFNKPDSLRVYEKKAVNKWLDLGNYKVSAIGDVSVEGYVPIELTKSS